MVYHTPEEMKEVLQKHPGFQEKLYCRGFLITNDEIKFVTGFISAYEIV